MTVVEWGDGLAEELADDRLEIRPRRRRRRRRGRGRRSRPSTATTADVGWRGFEPRLAAASGCRAERCRACCCSLSTPSTPASPSRCTTGRAVRRRRHDARRPPARASCSRRASRRVLAEAGAAPRRPHRRRRRRRPGPVHRAAGRAGHRPGRSALALGCRCTASARSTRSPCRSRDDGTGVRPGERFVVATDARRRRSTGRRTSPGRDGAAEPARSRGRTAELAGRPARRTCASVGRGAALYPDVGRRRAGRRTARRRRRAVAELVALAAAAGRRGRPAAARRSRSTCAARTRRPPGVDEVGCSR